MQRCVVCNSRERVVAHHIVRKSFLYYARFDTGNGITLCRACHGVVHAEFNGPPDFLQPMDAQGGEKIDLMVMMYGALVQDARTRSLDQDRFYHLSDAVLDTFKRAQGFPPDYKFPCSRLEQAHYVWGTYPQTVVAQLVRANLPLGERVR